MSIEFTLSTDETVAAEIRDDLAEGRKVTLEIEPDDAGSIPDQIDDQLNG